MGTIGYRDGSLVCPGCDAASLKILFSEELGADDHSDEVSRQVVVCSACGLRTLAYYEESRRGARERVHHYTVEPDQISVEGLSQEIRDLLGPAPQ